MLLPIALLALSAFLPSTVSAASIGKARLAKFAPTAFQRYIDEPSPVHARWMRDHYARMLVFSPFFDTRLSWYPNGWVYKDLYAVYVGSEMASAHPDWILQDNRGRRLYIPFDCSDGTCPQFAGDIGNPAFRADWIAAAARVLAQGYVGLMIDDVNMLIERVSNGRGEPITPQDPRTGTEMTQADWRRYMAEFVEEVRAAFPNTEIAHNALWFVPTSDPFVQRQLQAADLIVIERGFNDAGIVLGTGEYGFETLLGVIDWLHDRGRGVWIDAEAATNAEREYGLAAYLLTTAGIDYIGNTPGAEWDHWWPGYDADLGDPLGPRTHGGVFQRDFEGGRVLVNQPGARSTDVELGDTFLRVNGASVERVTLGPGEGVVLRRPGVSVTTTTLPVQTPAPTSCPPGGEPDADADGLADACDPCTRTAAGRGRAKLSFANLLAPPGLHRLTFEGYLTDVPSDPAIDPIATGVRVLIGDDANVARVDVTIAGGPYERRSGTGWRVNSTGTVWRYKNSASVVPSSNGIERVHLRRKRPGGRLRFSIKGRNGHYPIDEDALPLVGTIVLDPPVARTGHCGDLAFEAETPGRLPCSVVREGDRIRCR